MCPATVTQVGCVHVIIKPETQQHAVPKRKDEYGCIWIYLFKVYITSENLLSVW